MSSLIFILSSALLFLGSLDMPYGYYNFLRVTTTLTAVYGFYKFKNEPILRIVFILIISLYNPIIPVHLFDKNFWIYLDFVLIGFFLGRSISLLED